MVPVVGFTKLEIFSQDPSRPPTVPELVTRHTLPKELLLFPTPTNLKSNPHVKLSFLTPPDVDKQGDLIFYHSTFLNSPKVP